MKKTAKKTPERFQTEKLLQAIREAAHVVLFAHISPDGDTIGSMLAFKILLEQIDKRVTMVVDGTVPENLFFLPGIEAIKKPRDIAAHIDMGAEGTLSVALDVSSVDRMGLGAELFFQAPQTAQIDHHETNPLYAAINVVDGSAPATAVLIFRLQQLLGLSVLTDAAICLYTALSTDTGNFVYEGANAEAFAMMSALMEAGLPLAKYSRLLFRRKERAFVALLGKCLSSLTILSNGEIAGIQVSQADIKAVGATAEHVDGVVDYAIDIAGIRMAYFARETEDGDIKFSLRALTPFGVDQVAAQFNGGGHRLAAGCQLAPPMEEAVRIMQEALIKAREGSL